jgi:PRD1 phage membrane DNA delivery
MNQLVNGVLVVLTAIIGVAILSVIVSKNSNTVNVLQAGSSAFSGALGTAMSPVTGSSSFGSYSSSGMPSMSTFG